MVRQLESLDAAPMRCRSYDTGSSCGTRPDDSDDGRGVTVAGNHSFSFGFLRRVYAVCVDETNEID